MSMKDLERAVLAELKEVTKNNQLKMKNILEWSTGEVKVQSPDETLVRLPALGVNVVYNANLKK